MSKMLSSWKEIAHFFGKGVRTVQRWEKTLDLPIHRPPGAPSNVVLARTSDLEEWMHRGPVARAVSEEAAVDRQASVPTLSSLADLELEVNKLATWAGVGACVTGQQASADDRVVIMTEIMGQVSSILCNAPASRAA